MMLKSKETPKNVWVWIYCSQLVIALITAVIVAVLLYVINPPITQKSIKDDGFASMEQDWKKVLIVVTIVFVVVFIIPFIWRLVKMLYQNSLTNKQTTQY